MQLRTTGLTWQTVGDDIVVLDVEQSVYLKLNASGRVLWEHLAEPRNVSDLERALIDEFEIDDAQARADVAAFLGDMRQRRLLEE